MTPAEFDTRRRSLGLSVEETARLCGVQDRTVRRWQSGTSPIPDDAVEALAILEDSMHRAVEQSVLLASEKLDATGQVLLWRYRTQADQDRSPHARGMPLGAHAMMIAWVADALADEGIETIIEWAD